MRTYLSAVTAAVVLVLLAVLVPLSALSAWVDLEIDNTDRYVAAVAPLAADPHVQSTVGDLITDATMQQIDAGPLQSTVRDFLHQAVMSFTTTDAFRAAWNTANHTAHEAVTAALNGNTGQAVTIDLAPVTQQVKRNLEGNGVPFADRIPVQHTDITLISADRADQLRETFRWLRAASIWPAVGTVVFAALTVLVAWARGGPGRGRSGRAALSAAAVAGAGFALGALVLRAVIAVARDRVLAEVPDSETGAAAAVYDALTGSLRTTAWIVFGTGLAVAVCAVLGKRWAARRRTVP
ncbi:hypothetical protein OG497_20555 [Streptomyces sp. NBC_01242]|uniref:hypothetical protein n=1 Tax=unclassified Streptomyces TaxID=2593676 RepID=UPI00225ADBD0|nr:MULTISPECIES: hypothetical protein [unclassified Streptomyces]MCX4796421.1 hypothetical protein [Streptomyces sp. NBC_01242]WSJ37653.1 hypothetical protein OG772_17620 [Streptomyces sp. NBC_01321]WSP56117.1 hypothetical protein OG306_18295 [Streptomyces sp. NBC_01241]WSU23185.1 hypothetical protein OG508_21030 [Streptomyces sp. NBC_01108]